eukprot:5276578-Alexandrium_andersonii.AAC.1
MRHELGKSLASAYQSLLPAYIGLRYCVQPRFYFGSFASHLVVKCAIGSSGFNGKSAGAL